MTVAQARLPGVTTEVLQSLAQHRLLTTAQLRAIHTPGASARWAQRLLATLERTGLTGSIRVEGAQKLWHLAEAGADRLAASDATGHQRPKVLTAEQAAGQLWRHTLAVNDAGIALLGAARERRDEFGPLSWRHEVAHRIGRPGRRRGLVVADALVTYLSSDGDGDSLEYRFLELDRATLTVDRLVAKLAGYARLYRDRDERGEPTWQKRYLAFPPSSLCWPARVASCSSGGSRRRRRCAGRTRSSSACVRSRRRSASSTTSWSMGRSRRSFGALGIQTALSTGSGTHEADERSATRATAGLRPTARAVRGPAGRDGRRGGSRAGSEAARGGAPAAAASAWGT